MHFDIDHIKTEDLTTAWRNLGFARLPLDIIECPDRRIPRAASEVVATAAADGETEVTVLIPRRQYTHFWHRFLHDRTADAIAQALSIVPHSNVTIIPYHLGTCHQTSPPTPPTNGDRRRRRSRANSKTPTSIATSPDAALPTDRTPIAEIEYRQRVRVAGKVHTMRVQPHGGVASFECTLVDETGGITLVFLGRRTIPGIQVGTRMVVEGTAGEHHGRLAILNPTYELLASSAP